MANDDPDEVRRTAARIRSWNERRPRVPVDRDGPLEDDPGRLARIHAAAAAVLARPNE